MTDIMILGLSIGVGVGISSTLMITIMMGFNKSNNTFKEDMIDSHNERNIILKEISRKLSEKKD